MGFHGEFRTRSTDLLDEFDAYVTYGAYFVEPESVTLAEGTGREIPARKAVWQIARGHMDFLRVHGMRISCCIPYGSLFSVSPGIRNPSRWGHMLDADVMLLFQSERYPDSLNQKYIKQKENGFL